MKNTALALVLLLAACAVPPGAHDAGEQGGDTTVFVEDHHQKKDAAFLAAAGWFSEHYKGGRDAVQLSDKGSGTIIAKGACRWSKPVDSFQLHFHEGWAERSHAAAATLLSKHENRHHEGNIRKRRTMT
jgi:hypothetical protein